MDDGTGRLGRLERSLRLISRPGNTSKGYRRLMVAAGVFLISINAYFLLFSTGDDLLSGIGGILMGLSFVLWFGGGSIESRTLGSLALLSCLLVFPAAILLMMTVTYMEIGFGYLIFLAILVVASVLVWWYLRRSGARA
jgi:hypothetical protein